MNLPPITTEQVDALLDKYRPDRYSSNDHGWQAPVITQVAQRMPLRQAQQIAAEKIVSEREGRATRSVNSMLRKVASEKQWPLPELTHDLMRRPLSIGSERVCLAAATAKDFELWAIDERRDAAQEFSARSAACDGAEWLAQQMRQQGHALFADAYVQDDAA